LIPSHGRRSITYFVKVEDKIQLADITEELIQHFDKEMYGLQVGQLIVICINTDTKKRPAYRLYTIFVLERFCRTREEDVEDEGADRNSTKFDWYFWSRGAIRR
jgi:hypothetical protein